MKYVLIYLLLLALTLAFNYGASKVSYPDAE